MTDEKKISNVRNVRPMGSQPKPRYPHKRAGLVPRPTDTYSGVSLEPGPGLLGRIRNPKAHSYKWLIQQDQLEVVRVRCSGCDNVLWEKGMASTEMERCDICRREFTKGTTLVLEAHVTKEKS